MTYQIDPLTFESVLSGLHEKIAEGHQREQRLVHERDRLLDLAKPQKIWPGYVVCDRKQCDSTIAFDPLPDEPRLAAVLVAAGWQGHVCPKCQRAK